MWQLIAALAWTYLTIFLLGWEAGRDEFVRAKWDPNVQAEMDAAARRHPHSWK